MSFYWTHLNPSSHHFPGLAEESPSVRGERPLALVSSQPLGSWRASQKFNDLETPDEGFGRKLKGPWKVLWLDVKSVTCLTRAKKLTRRPLQTFSPFRAASGDCWPSFPTHSPCSPTNRTLILFGAAQCSAVRCFSSFRERLTQSVVEVRGWTSLARDSPFLAPALPA